MLAAHRTTFRAIAMAVVPESAELDEAGWSDVERIVETALADRPAAVRRQLGAFLRLVGLLPILSHGRRLHALDSAARARFLHRLERSRPLLLRRGLWGVRTLILMGYYGRPEAARAIGYNAAADGWDRVRSG